MIKARSVVTISKSVEVPGREVEVERGLDFRFDN